MVFDESATVSGFMLDGSVYRFLDGDFEGAHYNASSDSWLVFIQPDADEDNEDPQIKLYPALVTLLD